MSDDADAGRARGCLAGVRILDLTRLAPGPYCSMILADMGADVIVVGGGAGSLAIPAFSRGKRQITLDLKSDAGRNAFLRLAEKADVVLEGYRPGVMKRLGLDYETLKKVNSRLIYCALTGYGQEGPLSQEAGHDLNYAALSGAIGAFGPADNVPSFPLNLLADFAGGSLFAAIGILGALNERQRTGEGQFVDAAMVDGCLSLMTMHFSDWGKPVLSGRGDGLIAGSAPYYRCYRCSDGKFIAVGALERRFFENLWQGLGLGIDPPANHFDRTEWPAMERLFEEVFTRRSRDEWVAHFAGRDACLSPVLDPEEALAHPHNRSRHPALGRESAVQAPIMAGMVDGVRQTSPDDATAEVLAEAGLGEEEIAAARPASSDAIAGLAWPPM